MRKRFPLSYYLQGIRSGNRLILSRAITLIESSLQKDQELAQALISACMPYTGKAYRIGITGVPGVGKSTFIDTFGSFLLQKSYKLAVLAIDPSSPQTKGSILGDKTRMSQLSQHPLAYVRPSPTVGSLGGVARKTRESIMLCEAAGFDIILIETVGVGQSELSVHAMVDFFLLMMLPHAGDELQGIKKGIVEMADAIIINKSDGEYQESATHARLVFSQALRLFSAKHSGWPAKVLNCSASEGKGIEEIWKMLQAYQIHAQENGFWESHRKEQAGFWMEETIRDLLEFHFYKDEQVKKAWPILRKQVLNRQISPIQAAKDLLNIWIARDSGR